MAIRVSCRQVCCLLNDGEGNCQAEAIQMSNTGECLVQFGYDADNDQEGRS